MTKLKRVLVIAAIIGCLLCSGVAVFLRWTFDGIVAHPDADEVKAEMVVQAQRHMQSLKIEPVNAASVAGKGTPVAFGDACDALLIAALARNKNTSPEVVATGYSEEGGNREWVTVDIRFQDGTTVVLYSFQHTFNGCEMR